MPLLYYRQNQRSKASLVIICENLVVAPHPDDETLGCGGTLLRSKAERGTIGLLLMTELNKNWGWSDQRISQKADEIDKVRKILGIRKEHLYQ